MQKFAGTHGCSAFWILLSLDTALPKVDALCAILLMHIKRSPWVTCPVCPGCARLAAALAAAAAAALAAAVFAAAAAAGATLKGVVS